MEQYRERGRGDKWLLNWILTKHMMEWSEVVAYDNAEAWFGS